MAMFLSRSNLVIDAEHIGMNVLQGRRSNKLPGLSIASGDRPSTFRTISPGGRLSQKRTSKNAFQASVNGAIQSLEELTNCTLTCIIAPWIQKS
jgi:hypothetical protein